MSVTYLTLSYIYIKDSTVSSLQTESINRAYYVTKNMSELYDRVAYKYTKRKDDIYQSLQVAQSYFEKNGRHASLEILKKQLDEATKGLEYNIQLINSDYVIENTTYAPDLGLDFHIIPKALALLEEVYADKEHIDLSPMMNDAVRNEFMQYIVQRARNGEYMVQLGISLDDENVHGFTAKMHKDIPDLLSVKTYLLFVNYQGVYSFDLHWSKEYENMSKMDRLLNRDVKEHLNEIFEENRQKKDLNQNISELIEENHFIDRYVYKDGRYIHQVVMPFSSYLSEWEGTQSFVLLEFDETKADVTIQNMNIIVMIIWFLLFVFSSFIIFVIQARVVKPLSLLQSHMKQKSPITNADVFKRKDEVSAVSQSYNKLLKDLKREIISNEELLDQFKTFTANAIHQVRTPISVIKIAMEMIETPSEEAMLQIKASLISIEHMYDSLSYSLQQESIEFPTQNIDISKVLEERVALFSTVAAAHDAQILTDIQAGLIVTMNLVELEYLIDNNISNAIKYGTQKQPIMIGLREAGTEAVLSIDSSGKAIENKVEIFERYYREDRSRRGSGIGLHMVGSICKRNKILIRVDSDDDKNRFSYLFENMTQK